MNLYQILHLCCVFDHFTRYSSAMNMLSGVTDFVAAAVAVLAGPFLHQDHHLSLSLFISLLHSSPIRNCLSTPHVFVHSLC